MRRGITLGVLFLVAILTSGCGSGHVPVTGIVTFNGTPVSGATITFISEEGGKVFTGYSSDTGNFEIVSGQSKGVLPGMYKVTVIKAPRGVSGENTQPGDGDYLKDMKAMSAEAKKGPGGAGGPGMMMPGGGGGPGMMRPGGGGAGPGMMMPGGMMPGAGAAAGVKSELPAIYAAGTSTPLKVTIPHDGPIKLELKGDAPKAPAKK